MKPPIYIHILMSYMSLKIDLHWWSSSQRFPNWKLPINSSIVHNLHIFPIYFPYIPIYFSKCPMVSLFIRFFLSPWRQVMLLLDQPLGVSALWRSGESIHQPGENPWNIIWKIEKILGKTWKTMEHMDNNGKILGKNLGKY